MKRRLRLIRDAHNPNETLGKLYLDGAFICYTLELPWKDNERRVSRIPEGTYEVKKRYSQKYKEHLHVLKVPGRSYILIHIGNFSKDTLGCILVGKKRKAHHIEKSALAMKELNRLLPANNIELIVQ